MASITSVPPLKQYTIGGDTDFGLVSTVTTSLRTLTECTLASSPVMGSKHGAPMLIGTRPVTVMQYVVIFNIIFLINYHEYLKY